MLGLESGKFQVIDLRTYQVEEFSGHNEAINSVAIRSRIITGGNDGNVRIWDRRNCLKDLSTHKKKFDEGCLAVAIDQYAASGGADGLIKVFEI